MDTRRSSSLQSFDGMSVAGSDSALKTSNPGTPRSTTADEHLAALSPSGTSDSTESQRGPSIRHPRFYFPDGSLTLIVQGIAYRIQGSLLAFHSEHWAHKRRVSETTTQTEETLEGVDTSEMDAFMSILYPASFSRAKGPAVTTTGSWAYVLRLSTMWSCGDIRALAIEQLSDLAPPLEKLVLSLAHDVPEWRVPSYVALCLRPQALSESEAEKLAVRDVVRIMSAREAIRDGRVAATQEALAHFVVQHMCIDSRNPPQGGTARQHESIQPDAASSSEYLLLPPPVVVTPFTADERARISAQLSQEKYLEAISTLCPSQITPFCSILKESWGPRLYEGPLRDLVRAILRRGSTMHTGPAFVPTGIQLLRAISAIIRTEPLETQWPAPRFLELILNRDIRALRDTWSSYETSRSRMCTSHTRQKAHHYAYDDSFSSAALNIYPRDVRENWELYITLTSFLKDFIDAIVDAGLVKATVLRS